MKWLILAVFLTAGAGPALADAPKPITHFEVEFVADLAYHDGKDAADKQKLDLYLPKGQKNFPVLVFVHGGGYQKGDRKDGAALGRTFAARGVGTTVISYRLYPEVKHPGQIQDVAKAFAWVKRHVEKHRGAAENVFVGGHSAGAHLAALLATDETYLKAEKLALKDIKGVAAISGGYRILPIRKDVFGNEEAMRRASPFTYIKGNHPPFLILYGDKESPEREKLSREFAEALRKAGGQAEAVEIKDRDHQGLFTKIADGDPTTEAVLAFIAKQSAPASGR